MHQTPDSWLWLRESTITHELYLHKRSTKQTFTYLLCQVKLSKITHGNHKVLANTVVTHTFYSKWQRLLVIRLLSAWSSSSYFKLTPLSVLVADCDTQQLLVQIASNLGNQLVWILIHQQWLYRQAIHPTQNAVQRLLTFISEEHSCLIGLLGLQSLLLFGSDILTREIATPRASTNPHSCSSDLLLKLSDDELRLESSLRKLLPIILFLSDSTSCISVSWWEVSLTRFLVFGLNVSLSNVCSV
jgi:hypothetical protein